jgi:hypothetical protein
MKTQRIFAAGLATLLSLHLSSKAQAGSTNAGTKNGAFLKIATDARGVALGHAMAVMAEGTEGMRWNPAALSTLETKELAATHIAYFQDVKIENVAFGYPLEEGGIAGQVFYLSPGSLDGRDVVGAQTGDFKFYDLAASIGFGKKLRSQADGMEIDAGVALKIVQEKIADQQFQNPALDAGVTLAPRDDVKIGAALRDLSTSKANFPTEFDLGASYRPLQPLTGALGLAYTTDAPIRFTAASEYRFPEWNSAVRASYSTHDELDNSQDSNINFLRNSSWAGVAVGGGFEYKPPLFGGLALQIDYAIAPFGALGIAHTITLKVKW